MVGHDTRHDARETSADDRRNASAHEKRERPTMNFCSRGLAYGTINRIADGQPFIIHDKRSNDLQHRGCNLSRLIDDDCAERCENVHASRYPCVTICNMFNYNMHVTVTSPSFVTP